MKDRPILFRAPMVRAILDGRKSQTRRIVKLNAWSDDVDCDYTGQCVKIGEYIDMSRCPYGLPGDRLWVRETWGVWAWSDGYTLDEHIEYRADRQDGLIPDGVSRWRPSIHMPRKHSRITLEITGIRVERLLEISEEDARAEGVITRPTTTQNLFACGAHNFRPDGQSRYRDEFRSLWESINGAGSWDANPWVWVVEFKRVEAQT